MAPRGEIFDKKLAQEAIDECDNMKGGVILLFTDGRSHGRVHNALRQAADLNVTSLILFKVKQKWTKVRVFVLI